MSNTQDENRDGNTLSRLFSTHPMKNTLTGLYAVGPILIGHRGASLEFPENTIPSFTRALELGADMLELDVRLSKDGQVVVIHDPTVDRTTRGSGLVNSFTLAELKALKLIAPVDASIAFEEGDANTADSKTADSKTTDSKTTDSKTTDSKTTDSKTTDSKTTDSATAESSAQIATLEEVFQTFPKAIIAVEIKDESFPLCLKVVELIKRYDRLERTTIELIAISGKLAAALRKHEPKLITGHTTGEIIRFVSLVKLGIPRVFKPRGAIFEVPPKRGKVNIVTRAFVRAAHKKGIRVFVWTINDAVVMAKLFKMGVDGIFTDDLDLAKTVAEHIRLLGK